MTLAMMGKPNSLYLLDTNILVHFARGKSIAARIDSDFKLRSSPTRPLISIVSCGETLALAKKWNWGPAKVTKLNAIVAIFVAVPIDDPRILEAYADIDHWSQSNGMRMGKNDLWIAATAKVTGSILLTTDNDFDHLAPVHITRMLIDPATGATI